MVPRVMLAVLAAIALWTGAAREPHAATGSAPLISAMGAPLYPGVALYLRVSGTVVAGVQVDPNGSAAITIKSSRSRWLTAPTLANLKSWRFEAGFPGSFEVKFNYEIKGEPTLPPDNPHITLDLPDTVTVVARPIKPTTIEDPAGQVVH